MATVHRKQGTTRVEVPHLSGGSSNIRVFEIENDDLQYELEPKWCGDWLYLNAQNPEMYLRKLAAPSFVIWILIKNTQFKDGTYTKRRLVEEGYRQNVQVMLLDPYRFDLKVTQAGSNEITYDGKPLQLPDAAIPRLGANVDYFGLAVLRQLASMGVIVFNPVESVEIARDKLYTHQVLSTAGIPIPKTVLTRPPIDMEYIETQLDNKYPIVVKAASGSRGEQVYKVDSRMEMKQLLQTLDTSKPLILQEFLEASHGRDLRCLVLGDELVATMMRIAKPGEFKANVHQGGSAVTINPSPGLRDLVIKTAQLCMLNITGVDVLLDHDSFKVCEVNSSPGIEGLERATELNVAAMMIKYVVSAIAASRETKFQKVEEPTSKRQKTNQLLLIPVQEEHMM